MKNIVSLNVAIARNLSLTPTDQLMPLQFDEILTGPHLIAPYQPTRSGVDYLNLRQVNLNLMAMCIPGTNNVTRYVRPYSLICWVYWIYPKLLEKRGNEEASSEQLRLFREKVESLHLWGHRLEGVAGLPGTNSKTPPLIEGLVELSFKAWGGRRATNTSLQAAVQYGPSLLDLGGIGLLHKADANFYQVTERGENLAKAFDDHLRQSFAYESLIDLDIHQASEKDARDLFSYWRIDQTSQLEQEAFKAAFWDPESVNDKTAQGGRSSTIRLILDILDSTDKTFTEQDIRDRMAFPRLWGSKPSALEEGLQRQSRLWVLLQFRQLQRLAFETLMGWVEGLLIYERVKLPNEIVDKAHASVCEYLGVEPEVDVESLLQAACSDFGTIDDYLAARESELEWFDLSRIFEELLQLNFNEEDGACPTSFYTLLFLFNCRSWMESDTIIQSNLHDGGAPRISVGYWFQIVEKLKHRPSRELVDWTIKNLIVSQHFSVGTKRFDGERIRLRIILEEDGLEPLVSRPWHPIITPDRLGALLSLMVSSGLIRGGDDGYLGL
ncbi:MAG: hypothetical protein L3J39_10740 [Verrucomicrobiales bacterium]|nr:hypothetical protein [Verrucomicrobiales bacterium]